MISTQQAKSRQVRGARRREFRLGVVLLAGCVACANAFGPGELTTSASPQGAASEDLFSLDSASDVDIFPFVLHTGHSGTTQFRVPVRLIHHAAHVIGKVTWRVADASIAIIEEQPTIEYEGFRTVTALVSTLKPGRTFVEARTAGGEVYQAELLVASYTAQELTLGEQRYTAPVNPSSERIACASCHDTATGALHTPAEIALQSDASVLAAITTGIYPATMVGGVWLDEYSLRGLVWCSPS
jgi:hypothetical protein